MSHMVEKPRSKIGWGFYLKLVVTIVVLGVLSYMVDWPALWLEVKNSDPKWFAAGIALSACAFLIVTLRWWLLMKVQAVHLTYAHTLALNLIGQFFSAFLMGANGGDVMRIFYAMRAAPTQKAKVTMTIVVDRIFGITMLIASILAVLPLEISRISGDPALEQKLFKLIGLLFAIGFAAVILFFTPFHRFPEWCHRLWLKIPKREVIAGLHADSKLYLRKWPLTCGSILAAATVHFLNFTAAYCLAQAFSLNVSFTSMILIISFTMLAVGTPTSIGGHGIREVTLIALFALFAVTPRSNEICVAFSLMFYLLFQFSWSAVGGMVYLFYHHQVKREDGEAEALLEATK